jgi:hypothetical protein
MESSDEEQQEGEVMAIDLEPHELRVIRTAIARLYRYEHNRMKKIKAGKIKRTRPSEQAMWMGDIAAIRNKLDAHGGAS